MASQDRAVRSDAAANRDRVLDAATDLFRAIGDAFTTAAVAEAAGVGVGTVYRHFPTRDDLMAALVKRSFTLVVATAREGSGHAGTPIDCLRTFMHATLREREKLVLPLRGAPAIFDDETRALQRTVRTELQAILDRGHAADTIRGDVTPIDIIVTSTLLSQPLPTIDDWDAVATRQIEFFLDGLARRP